jgi:hypothetical protein
MKDMDYQMSILKDSFGEKDAIRFEEQQIELWRLVNDVLKGNHTVKPVSLDAPPQQNQKPTKQIVQRNHQQQQLQPQQNQDKDMTSATAITSLLLKQKVLILCPFTLSHR